MPDDIFRMLMCGNSGSGKTNLLLHMLIEPLLYYDEIYLYAKNLEQNKYQYLLKIMDTISEKAGYDVLTVSNDKIIPINDLDYEDNQKLVIFDDYICEKNQNKIVDYFLQGRYKNCSVIYLSQSFYKTPNDIRINCSHYCVFDFPSSRDRNMMSSELGVDKEQFKKATKKSISFCMLPNQRKNLKEILLENYKCIIIK